MKLQELTAKALRRGDKLANTLRKLVAKSDPNDASIKPLLKELEKALPRLHRLADQQEHLSTGQGERRIQKVSAKAGHEHAAASKSRSGKVKRQPASALAGAE
ncbi:hypothetical protein FHR70_001839 [Microvirga lupini]|uniref:Uncharacterized protein n=1 Tax=Microvirga lupini TaxID=420324 RepID=A0A7W4YVV3_9HYPH|nr:hypothetical protein [Microvirga lupini]MBB3018785.1 hypothetical protein [Microvirga lupini]